MTLRRERPSEKRRRVVVMPAWGFWTLLGGYGLAVSLVTLFMWVEVLGNG